MSKILSLDISKDEKVLEIERMVNYLQINIDDSRVAKEHKAPLIEVRKNCRDWLRLVMISILERREKV